MTNRTFFTQLLCITFLLYPFTTSAVVHEYNECVGRYQITLPSEVDTATTTPLIFGKKFVENPIQFVDGQPANLSSFRSDGKFEIVKDTTLSDYLKLKENVARRVAEAGKDNDYLVWTEMLTGRLNSYAYFGAASSGFNLFENGIILTFGVAVYGDDAEEGKRRIQEKLRDLSFRQDYEIPRGEGICLPGIFVESKKDHRDIGVTFRLKSHPDVTIFFKDKTSSQPVTMVDVHNKPVGRQTNLTSREQNEFVWKYSGLGDVVKLDHDPLPFHTVELDGRKGVASFGTITRVDGSTDYGYLATVQGDPNASVDTPDLTLLVQRTAKYAKGNPLVSKDELKQIAKDIAASIKRRSVQ